jgi:hypothetical protein
VLDGLVHVLQAELGDLVLVQVQQAGPDQADQPGRGRPREHPLPAHGDAVAHQPPERQREVRVHAAHQHHPAELPYGQRRGPDRSRARGGRQQVQHHVDRAPGR